MHHAPGNRAVSQSLAWRVKELITGEQWSPKQISDYLAKVGVKISHETIYKMIRNNANGTLAANCRHKIRYRHSLRYRHETKAPGIRNRVNIHERPKEADGSRFGDWEMGFIVDKDSNAILTMVERSTNFLIMGKLKYGKKAMRWSRRYGGCCCPTWESISRRSQRIA